MTAAATGLNSLAARVSRAVHAGRVQGAREETSLLAFLSIILTHRRVVAISAVAGTILFGIFAASEAELYVSRASFIVKGARAPIQLPGGASALGISLSAYADFSQSVVFYSDLVGAKTILRTVARESYATSDSKGQKRTLAAIYGIENPNSAKAVSVAADKLGDGVSSTISTRSGVVRLDVEAADPLLAQQLASNIIDELDVWSRARGHQQATLERKFIEGRVDEARAEVDRSEGAVASFLNANLEYEGSPDLRIEYDRLTREVMTRQQIYTSLQQTLEQAKIEEVRAPEALNIVETADLPIMPQRNEALRKTIIGLATGLLVGIVLAMLLQRADEKKLA